jgi:hypothetical protein
MGENPPFWWKSIVTGSMVPPPFCIIPDPHRPSQKDMNCSVVTGGAFSTKHLADAWSILF